MKRPTHTTVVAYLALFVALGGSSYAAVSLSRNSVKAKHIAAGAVGASEVKNSSLLAGDFAPGQLPAGAQGQPGPQGERGPEGPPNPNAVNSGLLDNLDSSAFARGNISIVTGREQITQAESDPTAVAFMDVPGFGEMRGRCSSGAGVVFANTSSDSYRFVLDPGGNTGTDRLLSGNVGVGGSLSTNTQLAAGDSSDRFTFHFGRLEGAQHRLAQVTVMAEETDTTDTCLFSAVAVVSR
jgi:hypothetical protein